MANSRSSGPRGNGADANGAPSWARELSAEVRASLRDAGEDRNRSDARMEELLRRSDARMEEIAARYHEETVAALQGAAKVGKLIRQDIHGLTQSIEDLVRVLRARTNGQGGNGRRLRP